MLPYTCSSSTTIEIAWGSGTYHASSSTIHRRKCNPYSINFQQTPVFKTQVNFLGNENLSPKSNESNNVYIRSEIQYSTPGVFLPSRFISVVWLSRFMAKLRNIFCTSEAWGMFLAKAGCNGNPEAPAAAVLVSLRSSCHVVLKCQTSWKNKDWFRLITSLNKDLNPKKTKLILGSAGMGGNEWDGMRERIAMIPKGRLMNPHSLLTRHQPKKKRLKCRRGNGNMVSVSASRRLRFVALTTELQDIFWSMRHAWKHLSTTWIHMGNTRQQIVRWQNHAKPFEHDGSCSRTLPPLLFVGRDHSGSVHGLRDSITARHDCLWHCNFSEKHPPGELNFIPKPASSVHFKVISISSSRISFTLCTWTTWFPSDPIICPLVHLWAISSSKISAASDKTLGSLVGVKAL